MGKLLFLALHDRFRSPTQCVQLGQLLIPLSAARFTPDDAKIYPKGSSVAGYIPVGPIFLWLFLQPHRL